MTTTKPFPLTPERLEEVAAQLIELSRDSSIPLRMIQDLQRAAEILRREKETK